MNIILWQVPDNWKTYIQEVDQEREMWLNSIYKAPLSWFFNSHFWQVLCFCVYEFVMLIFMASRLGFLYFVGAFL
jgi:hypothetical protein